MRGDTCSHKGCTKPKYCKGLCTLHYQQMRRGYFGPPVSGIPYETRFWAKVNKNGPIPEYRPDFTPCWLWTGSILKGGYGKFGAPARLAHRIAYELMMGKIPEGLEIDHLCRVRHCVNPDHMEPVTARDNQRRSLSVSGINSAKTECVNGHPFDQQNTLLTNNRRRCRACARDRQRAYRARRRSSVA